MRLRNLGLIGGLIMCVVWPTAYAQHTDRSFTTTSNDCSGVHWSDAVLKQYPTIASACQSVEEHDGVTYVKFSATVVGHRNQGKTLTLAVKDGGEVTVAMPPEATLSVNGRLTPMSTLRNGDQLNFYVPQNRLAAQFYPENQPTTTAQVVVAPFEPSESTVAERREDRRQERREARHEARRERLAATLPATASDVPLFAISGLLVLGLGVGLTAFRLRNP